MDLSPIGRHCALQSCNVLDFLPIRCSSCQQWFCKLHISPDLHDCSAARQHPSESTTSRRPKCAFSECDKPSLAMGSTPADSTGVEGESRDAVSKGCPGCQLAFCIGHRHLQSHACTSLAVGKADVKYEVARAILAKKFPMVGAPTSHTPVVAARQRKNPPSDPQKLAQLQKVNLMKLRHKAVPGDPKDKGSVVPVDQRIYVIARLEITGQSTKEIALWFRKIATTGKVLDLAVHHLGLSHTTSTLRLERPSAESRSHVLQNHLELSAQVEDGSTLVLTDSRSDE